MKRLTTRDESGYYHLRRGPNGGEINKITVVQHLGRLEDVALRPVSRELVEKVFSGCEMCREEKEVKSDNFCGAATMRIVGDSIDLRGDEKKIKFFGHIYAPSFSIRFCPFCGKPRTDEAVKMVLERLEALKDGSTAN